MRDCKLLSFAIFLVLFLVNGVIGEDPYRFFTWKVTYGDIYPLGVKQRVHILLFPTVLLLNEAEKPLSLLSAFLIEKCFCRGS